MICAMNATERRWVSDLERLLLRAPPRLSLLTIGDRSLIVLDEEVARTIDLHDGKWAQADLGHVRSECLIHGVSG